MGGWCVDVNKRMKKFEHKLTERLEMPNDVMFNLPKVTLVGNVQMYVENHKGIIEYTPNTIRIAVILGEIEIIGNELTIGSITQDEIHISGDILSIKYNR